MSEPVAWLYEDESGSKELTLDCNGEYARRLIENGWTEIPLFSYPPAQAEASTLPGEVDFNLPPHMDADFVAAWCKMEDEGYQYSEGNVAKVHLGWLMYRAQATHPTTPAVESESAESERARIVVWLREQHATEGTKTSEYSWAADAIDRGDHH